MPGAFRPACPFVAGPKIDDPRCFVGRREELRLLANWMSGSQPLSVNVVGGRLTGKSSLLQHFVHFHAQMVAEPSRFLVVFICLRLAKPATEAEFYQTLAKALHDKLPDLPACSGGSREFHEMLDKLAERRLLPVFCLDEFEKLFDHLEELNKDFYDRLRGLMSTSKMMLIIATRKTLKVCGEEHQLQSAFFNLGQLCELKDFSDEEAEELLLLPDPAAPALDAEERRLAKSWGGRQPHRLQLAALSLFEAKRDGKNTVWAKRRFKAQLEQATLNSVWNRPLGLALRSCRKLLDPLAEDSEKCRKVLLNIVLPLVVLYALLTGVLQFSTLLEGLLKKIGLL